MEWVLQVADEFDDAVGALRHGCLKVTAEVGMLWDGTRVLLAAVGTALKHTVRRRQTAR
jgi:hypothetical protein